MIRCVLKTAIIMVLLAVLSYAETHIVSRLYPGETVSHKALQLTRNASNWPEAEVTNPITGQVYGVHEYNKLPGRLPNNKRVEVKFRKTVVKTFPLEIHSQSAVGVCRMFKNSDCAATITLLNQVQFKSDSAAKINATIYIPKEYELIEKIASKKSPLSIKQPELLEQPGKQKNKLEVTPQTKSESKPKRTNSKNTAMKTTLFLLPAALILIVLLRVAGPRIADGLTRRTNWERKTILNRKNSSFLEDLDLHSKPYDDL